ncbi:DUF4145 domain-containing protein [Mycobacterium paragordonae]|uniref:DUF4145 domain-containing protein n=1 Tax=Mycobacterium paragordonae TaxID=1389713 RepID=A0ABQ1C0Q8_9MYCO|nr:DUF4145 domain-containing protein [Mycobacterium paragordonae]GFG77917.1 hypothetical protein MPRG_11930 [Mycobacterium paragordonae]
MVQVVTDRVFKSISGGPITQSVLQCPDCGRLTIVEHTIPGTTPREIGAYPADADLKHHIRHLPEDVDRYFNDARRVLDAGVPDAAAVQLRRTLEAAAAHFEVQGRNLVGRIRSLIEQGFVTRQFGEALHDIRMVGNLGAHATDQRVDEAAAQRVMNFTTLLLRNLFEVPGELLAAAPEAENDDEGEGEGAD